MTCELTSGEVITGLDAREIAPLVKEAAGSVPTGAYCESFTGRVLLLVAELRTMVDPTPFQGDRSVTHTKR